MTNRVETKADKSIQDCIAKKRSFALIAGAGSGKTTSLVDALGEIRTSYGKKLRQNGQQIACITFTNRAVNVIEKRLGFDDLYRISTLHSFLWQEIKPFQKDIKDTLTADRLPRLIEKAAEKDNGKETKTAQRAREKVQRLTDELNNLSDVSKFDYDDVAYSDYANGKLSHDDIIEIAGYLLKERPNFRRLLGFRYPFMFVDEAQDTFLPIVEGLNETSGGTDFPLIGYFGDPWQQIYEGRAGDFQPPENGETITKVENFRCSKKVVEFLNKFRTDIQQVAVGPKAEVKGSVEIRLIQSEAPEGARNRYTPEQLDRALTAMDSVLAEWNWRDSKDSVDLFLVRQMIARRLNFSELQSLFTGRYASQRAQDDYESGEHHLLKPFVRFICPLIEAFKASESRQVIDILRQNSPAYNPYGTNARRKLKDMIEQSKIQLTELQGIWETGTTKDILAHCVDNDLIRASDRLKLELQRPRRTEEFDQEAHGEEKGDWLADTFFEMNSHELASYRDFILENTPFSTQHGVKGEEYSNVLVVFDDVEAGWNLYNFSKLLTPGVAGIPTDGQYERGRKLAYVCFSRAEENLKVLLFTENTEATKAELITRELFTEDQISISSVVAQ